ncbi:cytochrome c [Filimonas lacunae]|uniref:Cytochrome c n=1 Tax=Filimonas lacunae TaxID=477680 RepID=A0A1N7QCM3_9BACT|nr:c-type cytochrome [Filimonas lacunae]SIT20611.1 cytochrome c [Filimonas lacunae]
MKQTGTIALIAFTCAALVACGGSSSNLPGADSASANDKAAVAQNTNAAQDTAGKLGTENQGGNAPRAVELMAQSDCLSCHKVREKLVGPSYEEISKKYTTADIDTLASKIIKGGQGSFGQVPMTPHPALSTDDAKAMVKYILSIK